MHNPFAPPPSRHRSTFASRRRQVSVVADVAPALCADPHPHEGIAVDALPSPRVASAPHSPATPDARSLPQLDAAMGEGLSGDMNRSPRFEEPPVASSPSPQFCFSAPPRPVDAATVAYARAETPRSPRFDNQGAQEQVYDQADAQSAQVAMASPRSPGALCPFTTSANLVQEPVPSNVESPGVHAQVRLDTQHQVSVSPVLASAENLRQTDDHESALPELHLPPPAEPMDCDADDLPIARSLRPTILVSEVADDIPTSPGEIVALECSPARIAIRDRPPTPLRPDFVPHHDTDRDAQPLPRARFNASAPSAGAATQGARSVVDQHAPIDIELPSWHSLMDDVRLTSPVLPSLKDRPPTPLHPSATPLASVDVACATGRSETGGDYVHSVHENAPEVEIVDTTYHNSSASLTGAPLSPSAPHGRLGSHSNADYRRADVDEGADHAAAVLQKRPNDYHGGMGDSTDSDEEERAIVEVTEGYLNNPGHMTSPMDIEQDIHPSSSGLNGQSDVEVVSFEVQRRTVQQRGEEVANLSLGDIHETEKDAIVIDDSPSENINDRRPPDETDPPKSKDTHSSYFGLPHDPKAPYAIPKIDLDPVEEGRNESYHPMHKSDDDQGEGHVESEVELVEDESASSVISKEVKIAMDHLHLQNVALVLPQFMRVSPPSGNDKAILKSMEDFLSDERARRKSNATSFSQAAGSILVIANSISRARGLQSFLQRHSKLTVAMHGVGKAGNDRRKPGERDFRSLNDVTDSVDIVVSLSSVVLKDASRNIFSLRRVFLLVLDSIECAWSRASALAMLMRDFYRALPEPVRPRAIGIAGKNIDVGQMAPIEFNLFTKFASISTDTATWKTCRGKGHRRLEHELLDVEYLKYRIGGYDGQHEYSRLPSMKKHSTDPRTATATDIVMEEIGPMGVALYRRRKGLKRRHGRSSRGNAADHDIKVGLGDCHTALGLSEKMMSLMHELFQAYRASTELDSLMVIVHAGKPVVACAMREVIGSLGVFESLVVNVALGSGGQELTRNSSSTDGFELNNWQGEDTDDEAVSDFVWGGTNVLIVADSYLDEQSSRRPLPSCPLVIRFDQSEEKPKVDGGGGRCRVIVFREINRRSLAKPSRTEKGGGKVIDYRALRNTNKNSTEAPDYLDGEGATALEPEKTRFEVGEKEPIGIAADAERKARPVQRVFADKYERRHAEAIAEAQFFCKPAQALMGPRQGSSDKAYLYRPLLYATESPPLVHSLSDITRIGVEDFVFALSNKLDDRDTMISLKEFVSGTGYGTPLNGYIKLEYQGSISFPENRLTMAREYTTRIFSLMNETFSADMFKWGKLDPRLRRDGVDIANDSYLRRYLVLPTIACEVQAGSSSKGTTEVKDEPMECEAPTPGLFDKYFLKAKKPKSALPKVVKVDWEGVKEIVNLQDAEKHNENCREGLCSVRDIDSLEGKLLFSTFPAETVVISGQMNHDSCPLSTVHRSKKFNLNSDGTFIAQEDLVYLAHTKAPRDTIRRQANATGVKKIEVIDLDNLTSPVKANASKEDDSMNDSTMIPVRWCNEERKLVPDDRTNKNLQKFAFDCQRNVMKKRSIWTGTVHYTWEHYYNRFYNDGIQNLHQPMIPVSKPTTASLGHFRDVLNGLDLSEFCYTVSKSGHDQRLVVPELSRVYPISLGALFLPVVLFHVEQHLLVCELRQKLDPSPGFSTDTTELVRAVTASNVNNTTNYERLEFLGDSVLKLSTTLRLMIKHAHQPEGVLSKERGQLVANSRLKDICVRAGLYNYYRFKLDTLAEWKPPGTDTRGKERNYQMKGLADAVEALCGAYFLTGARKRSDHSKSNKKPRLDESGRESTYDSGSEDSVVYISDSDDGEEGVGGEEGAISEQQSQKRSRSGRQLKQKEMALTGNCIMRGYESGYKFLEQCGALVGQEPTHRELLLSSIHSMHPRHSKPPTELSLRAFPNDVRLTSPEMAWETQFGTLEETIGYKFKRRHFLMCALTHGSHVKDNGAGTPDTETFERLEFLGDAVADLCVICYLYERNSELGPGELTSLKGNVVSNESFARISVANGFHKYLYHGSASVASEIALFLQSMPQDLTKGGIGSHIGLKRHFGERSAPKILGDIFEAIIGAVFVDSGLPQAWKTCMRLLEDSLRINADPERDDFHPCDKLKNQVTQIWKICRDPPKYDMEKWTGLGKSKLCAVSILGEKIATGKGSDRKRARLTAASAALELLMDKNPESHGAKLLVRLHAKGLEQRVAQRRSA